MITRLTCYSLNVTHRSQHGVRTLIPYWISPKGKGGKRSVRLQRLRAGWGVGFTCWPAYMQMA